MADYLPGVTGTFFWECPTYDCNYVYEVDIHESTEADVIAQGHRHLCGHDTHHFEAQYHDYEEDSMPIKCVFCQETRTVAYGVATHLQRTTQHSGLYPKSKINDPWTKNWYDVQVGDIVNFENDPKLENYTVKHIERRSGGGTGMGEYPSSVTVTFTDGEYVSHNGWSSDAYWKYRVIAHDPGIKSKGPKKKLAYKRKV